MGGPGESRAALSCRELKSGCMFSLKSWLTARRVPADDDLISAYVDGRLSGAVRRAFEERISSEPDLGRKVEATRKLISAAASLSLVQIPRNFILPTSTRKPATPSVVWWRLGSAAASVVFVFCMMLSAVDLLAPRGAALAPALAPAPYNVAAPAATVAPAVTANPARSAIPLQVARPIATQTAKIPPPSGTAADETSAVAAAVPSAPPNATATVRTLGGGAAISPAPATSISAASLASPVSATPPEVSSHQALSKTAGNSEAHALTQVPRASPAVEQGTVTTPLHTTASLAEHPMSQQTFPTPLFIAMAISLVLAIWSGIIGWLRR